MNQENSLTDKIQIEKQKTERIIQQAVKDLISEIGFCDIGISLINTFSLSNNNIKHLVNTEVKVDIRI